MGYLILADVIVVVHFAYVSYVVFGELLILVGIPFGWQWIRNIWFRLSHLVMILIVAAEAYFQFECPLTTWERQLQEAACVSTDERSFIGRLIGDIMFCPDDSCAWPWLYGGFAALVVLTFVIAPPKRKRAANEKLRMNADDRG